jgi:hypothetical protein
MDACFYYINRERKLLPPSFKNLMANFIIMLSGKRNSILITACILLFGCASSDKKGTKEVSGESGASDISVIIKVNNEKNNEFSEALADFYRERKFKTAVEDSTAGSSVIGDLSEEDNKVKLILRIYKGRDKKPCSNHIYEEMVKGDLPEPVIEQGFRNLLNKMKANPQTPVCP